MSRENNPQICNLLFEQIEKPTNLEMCWAINVYDNKYRVNLYTRLHDPIWDMDRVRISHSYFCILNDKELTIRV